LGFLSSFILGLLSILLFFVYGLFISLLFGDLSFLSFLNFSDSFFSECFLVFSLGVLQLVDSIKGDTFNGSFLFSFIISSSLCLANIGLFYFLMESSPCGSPSESLSFDFSLLVMKYLKLKFRFLLDKKRKGLPSLATNLTPLPG
jgi:hypothetical protein